MTCRRGWIAFAALCCCQGTSPGSAQRDAVGPNSTAPSMLVADASEDVALRPPELISDAAQPSARAVGESPSERTLPTRTACGGRPIRLPQAWDDAYSLSRKQLQDGVSITVVGRIRDVTVRGASLEAVCRPSEAPLEIAFAGAPCGVRGELLVVRGVVQSRDLLTALGAADGPAVLVTDGAVVGTTSAQQVCRALAARNPQPSRDR